jgi:hypothetical protein
VYFGKCADAVGQNDEILRGVEQLARSEQLTPERPTHESRAGAGRAVEHDDRIPHDALRVALRLAEREVVDSKLGKRLAALELEVANDVIGALVGLRLYGDRDGDEEGEPCGDPRDRARHRVWLAKKEGAATLAGPKPIRQCGRQKRWPCGPARELGRSDG